MTLQEGWVFHSEAGGERAHTYVLSPTRHPTPCRWVCCCSLQLVLWDRGSEQPLLQEGLFGMAEGKQMEYFLARLLES